MHGGRKVLNGRSIEGTDRRVFRESIGRTFERRLRHFRSKAASWDWIGKFSRHGVEVCSIGGVDAGCGWFGVGPQPTEHAG